MSDSTGAPSTTKLIVNGRYDEVEAGGTLKSGHLVKLNSSGVAVVHATAGGFGESMFVTEDLKRISGGNIDTTYASGDKTSVVYAAPGDVLYVWLKDGETIVIGDHLISAGDGTLKKTTGSPTKIFAVALEALDLAGGASADGRIKVRCM